MFRYRRLRLGLVVAALAALVAASGCTPGEGFLVRSRSSTSASGDGSDPTSNRLRDSRSDQSDDPQSDSDGSNDGSDEPEPA